MCKADLTADKWIAFPCRDIRDQLPVLVVVTRGVLLGSMVAIVP